jgi:hypothetical protein
MKLITAKKIDLIEMGHNDAQFDTKCPFAGISSAKIFNRSAATTRFPGRGSAGAAGMMP